MNNLPLYFQSSTTASSELTSPWKNESAEFSSSCAIPVEFGGPGGALSPEDLFAQTLASCLIGTFKVYAANSKLDFSTITVGTRLTVDKNDAGQTVMKACQLNVSILGASKPDRALMLLKKSFASGFILNSVKTELSLDCHVEGLIST